VSNADLNVTGLAGRYATALFDLAREAKSIDAVAESLGRLGAAIEQVPDVRVLMTSPVIRRDAAGKAVAALATSLSLDGLTSNFLGVLSSNRRLAALPGILRAFKALAAAHKGEMTAEVTSAHALSEAQHEALKAKLRTSLGRDVTLVTRIDPAILGGLVVQIGSKLIDSSLKTKLDSLSLAMIKAA
jgi:F-type H+-transporting ATPase subunit delta